MIEQCYEFTISPASASWVEFRTFEEQMEATQLPEEIISKMSTTALLETVVNSWWGYGLITAYDDIFTGLDVVAEHFNGLNEFLKRKDAFDVCLNYYQEINPSQLHKSNTWKHEENLNSIQVMFLETILCSFQNSISEDQFKSLISVLEKKMNQREQDPSGMSSNAFTATALSGCPYYPNHPNHPFPSLTSYPTKTENSNTVKTPKGSFVTVQIPNNQDYTYNEISELDDYYQCAYPSAVFISSSTAKYNCHSYSFYQQSSNNYWINPGDVSIYWNDGSYTLKAVTASTLYSTSYNAMKVVWGSGNAHSAISNNTTSVISKWGIGPVMQHWPYTSPYPSGNMFWYARQ